jgi:hypothetical protein
VPWLSMAEQVSLAVVLCQLLCVPLVRVHTQTQSFIYDTLALCIDEMSQPTSVPPPPVSQEVSEGQRALATVKSEVQPLCNVERAIQYLLDLPRPREDGWLGLLLPIRDPKPASQPQGQQNQQVGFAHSRPGSQMFQHQHQQGQRMPGTPVTASQAGIRAPGHGFHGAMLPPQSVPRAPQTLTFAPPVPFHVKHWDLLPDQGSTGPGPAANDTAISLGLFGIRKV